MKRSRRQQKMRSLTTDRLHIITQQLFSNIWGFGIYLFILWAFFLLFVNCIFVFLVFSLVCFRMGPAFLGRIRLFLNFIQILFVIIFLVNFVCFVTFFSRLGLDCYQAMSTQFNSTIFSYFLVLNQILDIKIAVEFYLNHFTKI